MAGPSAYELLHHNMAEALLSLSQGRKEMKSYSNLTEEELFDKYLLTINIFNF